MLQFCAFAWHSASWPAGPMTHRCNFVCDDGMCNFSSDAKFHKNKDAYFHIKLPSLIVRPAALQRGYKSNNRVFIQSSCCNIYTYYSIIPHCFNPGLKPSFSVNPSHHSLPFFFRTNSMNAFSRLFTDTSEHIRFLLLDQSPSFRIYVPQFTFCISHIAIFTRTVLRVIKGNWYAD